MNKSCARITLDLQQASSPVFVAVKKSDIGRDIRIKLSDGGFPYEISSDCYAVLTAKKPDGNVLYNHCDIRRGTIIYTITEQTTAAAGRMKAEIKLYGADDSLITSATFRIIVDGTIYSDSEVESAPEFTALTNMMNQMQGIAYSHPRSANATVSGKVPSGKVFYGDINARGYYEFDGMQLVLASFDVLKAEDIIGKTITTVENGTETYYTLRAEDLNDRGAEDDWHKYIEVKPVSVNDKPIAICVYKNSSTDGGETGLPPGVYYRYVEDCFYTKALRYFEDHEEWDEQVFELEHNYLPDRNHYDVFDLTYSVDENGVFEWSATKLEVDKAFMAGKLIRGTSPDGYPIYLWKTMGSPFVSGCPGGYWFIEIGKDRVAKTLTMMHPSTLEVEE